MKLNITLLSIAILALSFSACSVKEFNYVEKNLNKKQVITKVDNETYKKDLLFQWKISKGDRIEIQAYNQSSNSSSGQLTQLLSNGGQKNFTQRYGDEGILIPNNGIVRLPLIGAIKLSGLTEDEASKLLISQYKIYLKHPYVSVKILNQKLFVVGEVKKPGVVLVTNGTMNLFEALAQSGDLTDYADRNKITILRGDMRNPEVREINLNDFKAMRYASLILRPNDVVYVRPRESRAEVVGVQEHIPTWDLVSKVLSPFTSAAVLYGVVK
jgi:polysaccharide export outer membrane protein